MTVGTAGDEALRLLDSGREGRASGGFTPFFDLPGSLIEQAIRVVEAVEVDTAQRCERSEERQS